MAGYDEELRAGGHICDVGDHDGCHECYLRLVHFARILIEALLTEDERQTIDEMWDDSAKDNNT